MLFDVISKGEDVTITYRGSPKAKLISIDNDILKKDHTLFGIWKNKNIEVDNFVRDLRKGRNFDL